MRILRTVLGGLLLLIVAATVFVWLSQQPLLDRIEIPSPSSFGPEVVAEGARLAAIGNCRACHTAPGRTAFSGNRAIPTPFGTVYSSNITPAPGSGIGHWSEAAFRRAMRHGISRRGHHLFPAFPYDHFSRLSDNDLHALYAFLMTRQPVEIYLHANDLTFPLDERWPMAFWNLLFLDRTPFRPDPRHDAEWNRGAYLVDGLGHCSDCHAPRNLLGAEARRGSLAGGEAEGWEAPALDASSPAPVPWDAAHLFAYLRRGWDPEHGAAAGPMLEITENLGRADPKDVHAIAAYLAAQHSEATGARRERAARAQAQAAGRELPQPGPGEALGAEIFAGGCARCHVGGQAMVPPRGISLALSTAIHEADPRNAIHIVLDGIRPPDELPGPLMPGFAGALTDAQVAAVLSYARAHYGTGPAWRDLPDRVRKIRDKGPS